MTKPRYCIVLNVVGLEHDHLLSGLVPNISKIADSNGNGESAFLQPVFPAVTCTVQASILSGKYPDEHGIISNGLYDRSTYTPSFWEQPSSLVQADRVWDRLGSERQENQPKTAVLFWQNTLYAKADAVVTPRPIHLDDKMIMWCYSKPVGFYEDMIQKFGEFNLASYWGPLASHRSSEWIAQAAQYTMENVRPNCLFAYIPHVDYSAQRFGKKSSQVQDDLKKADGIVGSLMEKASNMGIMDETQFIVLSEYGFNDVAGDIPLNRILRDAGLVAVRTIGGKEYLDFEFSKAFAMVDHQVAHIYVKDGYIGQTRKTLEDVKGLDMVLSEERKKELHIDHPRSGELVAISDRDKWFSYYWWHDNEKAPDFARKVDIHRKPGYDPVELFFDPKTRSIPLDPSLIKGSHGRPADLDSGEGLALFVSSKKTGLAKSNPVGGAQSPSGQRNSPIVNCTDIAGYLGAIAQQ